MEQTVMMRSSGETIHFDYEKRRYNDTVTWLSEVLPGHMRTPFEYQYDGHELYADDGSSLGEIFDDAIKQAEHLPAYERRRRRIEKEEYRDMLGMMRGDLPNTMVVISDFPPELMNAAQDVGGYNVNRKQTMLRVLTKTPEGTLKMYSQSLDGSNRQALESIFHQLGKEAEPGELLGQRLHLEVDSHEQEFMVDWLMGVYDRSLEAQFGGHWYAGRQDRPAVNTYDFVRSQKDLLAAYLTTTDNFSGGAADYNLAAAFEARYRQHQQGILPRRTADAFVGQNVIAQVLALEEMNSAGAIARQTGITYSGCGATISAESDSGKLGLGLGQELESAGYGNKADKLPDDKYGSRYFKCPKGHQNTRWEKDKLIEQCQVCKCDVGCGGNSKKMREKAWLN